MQSNRLTLRGSVFVVDQRYYSVRGMAPLVQIHDSALLDHVIVRFDYQTMAFSYNNPMLGRQISMGNSHALGTGNFVFNVGVMRDIAPLELSFVSPIIRGMRKLAIDPYGQMKNSDVLTSNNTVKVQPKTEEGNPVQCILPDLPKLGNAKFDTPLGVLLSTLVLNDPTDSLDPFEASPPQPGLRQCLASEALSEEEIDDPNARVAVIHSRHLFSYLIGTLAQDCGIERIYSFRWPLVVAATATSGTKEEQEEPVIEEQPYLLVMPIEIAKKLLQQTKRMRTALRSNLVDSDKAQMQLYRAVYHDAEANATVTRTALVDPKDGSVQEIQNQRSLPFQIKFVVSYARAIQCQDMIVHGAGLSPPPIFEDPRKLTVHSCLLDRENHRVLTCPDLHGNASKKRRQEMVSAAYHRIQPKSIEDFNSRLDSILIECMRSSSSV